VPNPYPTEYDPSQSGIATQNSAQVTVPNVFRPGLDWVTRAEFAREVAGGLFYDDVAARIGLIYRRGSHSVGGSLNFIRYFNVKLQGLQRAAEPGQRLLQRGHRPAVHRGLHADLSRAPVCLRRPRQRDRADPGFYASIDLQQT